MSNRHFIYIPVKKLTVIQAEIPSNKHFGINQIFAKPFFVSSDKAEQ